MSYTKDNIPKELIKAARFISEDKLKKAEPILRDYLKDYPLDVNAMKLLGDIGVKFRAYKDAGYLFSRALDLSPDYDEARLSYANLLYKRQLPFQALEQICVGCVETGSMTKDLAILVGSSQKYLTTNQFLDEVDGNLKKKLN